MWPRNAFTDRLNLKWPILQAPMGRISTPALAAAVSNAGGLGALGMWGFSAEEAERRIAGFQQLSGGSLNVNYPLWPEPEDYLGYQRADASASTGTLRREWPRSGTRAKRFGE
jgi:NAD(P)H-dependent flavin oxidoreductase YrpB (nitropropane dioxygenase family)